MCSSEETSKLRVRVWFNPYIAGKRDPGVRDAIRDKWQLSFCLNDGELLDLFVPADLHLTRNVITVEQFHHLQIECKPS